MTHPGIRCSVRDCDGTCTHELLHPDGRPFFDYDGSGLYICASCATDFDSAIYPQVVTRPITVDDDGEVEVAG